MRRLPAGAGERLRSGQHRCPSESYAAAEALLAQCGYTLSDVRAGAMGALKEKAEAMGLEALARVCGVGVPTLADIIKELMKPGRDPRDELPAPILRTDVMEARDLKPGMELQGTVRNVIDFGAFVDIGVHQDGLVHISKLPQRVKHPSQLLSVGDVVTVWVLEVDEKKKRISLTMKNRNTGAAAGGDTSGRRSSSLAAPDRPAVLAQLLRGHPQQQQGPRRRQHRQGRHVIRQAEGQLLPLHHPSLHRHQLPLDGAPQLPPLPAGQGQGVPGPGALAYRRRGVQPGEQPPAPPGRSTVRHPVGSCLLRSAARGRPPAARVILPLPCAGPAPQLPAHRLPDALALLGYPEILHRSRPFPPQSGAFPLFYSRPVHSFPFCLSPSLFFSVPGRSALFLTFSAQMGYYYNCYFARSRAALYCEGSLLLWLRRNPATATNPSPP